MSGLPRTRTRSSGFLILLSVLMEKYLFCSELKVILVGKPPIFISQHSVSPFDDNSLTLSLCTIIVLRNVLDSNSKTIQILDPIFRQEIGTSS